VEESVMMLVDSLDRFRTRHLANQETKAVTSRASLKYPASGHNAVEFGSVEKTFMTLLTMFPVS
jgi:hypothetical protein